MKSAFIVVTLEDSKTISIETKQDGRLSIASERLNEQQLFLVNVIAQATRCYCKGIDIDTYFDPFRVTEKQSTDKLYKCEWMRSGKLILRDDNCKKKFKHADTVEEAFTRQRVFTCMSSVYSVMPKMRINQKTKEK